MQILDEKSKHSTSVSDTSAQAKKQDKRMKEMAQVDPSIVTGRRRFHFRF
jgi:hypothetical protein